MNGLLPPSYDISKNDPLPPGYDISNKVDAVIANKFYINNNLINNCKVITNSKTNDIEYKFVAIGQFHKEFFIYDSNDIRLITFKFNKVGIKPLDIMVLFDNKKYKENFRSVKIEKAEYMELILIDYNEKQHQYKLKKSKNELTLYYSNELNKKVLAGSAYIDFEKSDTKLGYFNFNIPVNKHLEALILGMILIQVSLKEKNSIITGMFDDHLLFGKNINLLRF